jgi:hypothetical protein
MIHAYLTAVQRLELLSRCNQILRAKMRAGFKPRHIGYIMLSGYRPGGERWRFKVLAALENHHRVVVTCLYTGETLACSKPHETDRLDTTTEGAP